jgi:hypothetical protein
VAGDVNGSCNYNGLDITYAVAYFKGGPDPFPCPDCPPNPLINSSSDSQRPIEDFFEDLRAKDYVKKIRAVE